MVTGRSDSHANIIRMTMTSHVSLGPNRSHAVALAAAVTQSHCRTQRLITAEMVIRMPPAAMMGSALSFVTAVAVAPRCGLVRNSRG